MGKLIMPLNLRSYCETNVRIGGVVHSDKNGEINYNKYDVLTTVGGCYGIL